MMRLLCALMLLVGPAVAHAADASDAPVVLTGRFVIQPDKGAAVEVRGRMVRLSSKDDALAGILEDTRLVGKEVRASGRWREKDRRLEVEKLQTMHNGKPHEIAYYCDICNVWAVKPGPCVCCQQPVELRELTREDLERAKGIRPQ